MAPRGEIIREVSLAAKMAQRREPVLAQNPSLRLGAKRARTNNKADPGVMKLEE